MKYVLIIGVIVIYWTGVGIFANERHNLVVQKEKLKEMIDIQTDRSDLADSIINEMYCHNCDKINYIINERNIKLDELHKQIEIYNKLSK